MQRRPYLNTDNPCKEINNKMRNKQITNINHNVKFM